LDSRASSSGRYLLKPSIAGWPPGRRSFDGAVPELNDYHIGASNVVTFHNYNDAAVLRGQIRRLAESGYPLVCTEWMARTANSRPDPNLRVFKETKVGRLNWGLVSGKSNTIFPWGSKKGAPEPKVWFQDLFVIDDVFAESSVFLGSDPMLLSTPVQLMTKLKSPTTYRDACDRIVAANDRRGAGLFVRAVLALRRDERVQGRELQDVEEPGSPGATARDLGDGLQSSSAE
jgi:hypothetical protein